MSHTLSDETLRAENSQRPLSSGAVRIAWHRGGLHTHICRYDVTSRGGTGTDASISSRLVDCSDRQDAQTKVLLRLKEDAQGLHLAILYISAGIVLLW